MTLTVLHHIDVHLNHGDPFKAPRDFFSHQGKMSCPCAAGMAAHENVHRGGDKTEGLFLNGNCLAWRAKGL